MARRHKQKQKPDLSGLELELMREIWSLETATAAEVKARLSRPLADTTIHTVLGNLQKKGYVGLVPTTERAKRYRPLVEREVVAGRSLGKLIQNLFHGSPAEAMMHLVKSEAVDEEELAEIRKLLDERTTKGGRSS